MNLFNRTDPVMTEPTVTGTDVLRQILKARNKSPHALSLIARETEGVSAAALESFAAGEGVLSAAILQSLTKILYPNAEYDPGADLLRTISLPAQPLGVTPEAYNIDKHSRHHPPPIGPWTKAAAITSLPPSPRGVKPLARPGWAC